MSAWIKQERILRSDGFRILSKRGADWILCTQVLDDIRTRMRFLRSCAVSGEGGLILSVSFVWELHDLPMITAGPRPSEFAVGAERL
jgi:hypothetical protein